MSSSRAATIIMPPQSANALTPTGEKRAPATLFTAAQSGISSENSTHTQAPDSGRLPVGTTMSRIPPKPSSTPATLSQRKRSNLSTRVSV